MTWWRYAIIESDHMETQEWLVQLPVPIQAIYTSGGQSIHALTRIDAPTKGMWDHAVRTKKMAVLAVLGADPKAMTAVRLSRLPQCYSEQTGNLQELYF